MHWFLQQLRKQSLPRFTMTVAAGQHDIGTTPGRDWQRAFALLDERSIPATWAVFSSRSDLPLGEAIVASSVPHEFALTPATGDLVAERPRWEQWRMLAQRVNVPLRTLVSSTAMHPSLLAQLGIVAWVPASGAGEVSRTGSLKALAWNAWELPATDRLTSVPLATSGLTKRLKRVLGDATRMHLLASAAAIVANDAVLADFFDHLADYHARGYLRIETAGEAGHAMSSRLQAAA